MSFTTDSDGAIIRILGQRLRRYRLDRDLTQAQLAMEAGISKRTLERMEAGGSTQLESFLRVLRSLDLLANLDAVVPEPLESPLRKQARQRARGERERERELTTTTSTTTASTTTTWVWGDEAG